MRCFVTFQVLPERVVPGKNALPTTNNVCSFWNINVALRIVVDEIELAFAFLYGTLV